MNAKSVMALAMLGLGAGKAFSIQAEGPDEDAAIEGLARHLLHGIREYECIDFWTYSKQLEVRHDCKLVEMNPLEVLSTFAAQQIGQGACTRGKVTES